VDPRALPAIGKLIARPEVRALIDEHGRAAVVDALRAAVDAARAARATLVDTSAEDAVARARALLSARRRGSLVRVINASGVVLHTNVGRAPLAREARDAAASAGSGYASVELDLESGSRGSRHVHAAARLARLTGAEDALVANNAAAALMLALAALSRGGEVVVSRGELVEIGGAFRIPEIVEAGGARLREVGTTNRTRIADYARALSAPSAHSAHSAHSALAGATDATDASRLLLKVHRSNFALVGFTEEASLEELAALAAATTPPPALVSDLGSGLLVPGSSVGLPDEPDVPSAVAAGCDVVIFSGDKLLGGPQAGLAVGRAAAIAAMRAHPLMRALRCGKLVLAALDATLALYERGVALTAVPALRSLTAPATEVQARAQRLCAMIAGGEVVATEARVGGGAQPLRTLASFAVRLEGDAISLAARLRGGDPAVLGRIESDALLLDLRAVDDDELEVLAARVRGARQVT
jgi:L-seryl-tRNA(Ser) seleniumtransferase